MNNRTIKSKTCKKNNFLASPNINLAYQLSAKDLGIIADQYEKLGVKIIINGTTKFGNEIIAEKKKAAFEAREKVAKADRLPKSNIENFCLNENEAKREIKYLQCEIKQDEAIGYFYTNQNSTFQDHFEVLIITKDKIIKPLVWDNVSGGIISNVNWHTFQISDHFILKTTEKKNMIFPQAGKFECATLGFLYLKTLLKNNASQLNELTLSIPYLEHGYSLRYFFIPSPQCLYYSQSSLFNEIIKEMLMNVNNGVVNHEREDRDLISIKVKTVEELLNETISNSHNSSTISTCQSIMQNLPNFRKKWMAEFEMIDKKRKEMDFKNLNRTLTYHTHRYHNICDKISIQYSLNYLNEDIKRLKKSCWNPFMDNQLTQEKIVILEELKQLIVDEKIKNKNDLNTFLDTISNDNTLISNQGFFATKRFSLLRARNALSRSKDPQEMSLTKSLACLSKL